MQDEQGQGPKGYAFLQILAEAIALFLGITIAEWAFAVDSLPALVKAGALVALILAPSGKSNPNTPRLSALAGRLPVWAAVGAASAIAFYIWARPDPRFYAYLPLWIVLAGTWYCRHGALRAVLAFGALARATFIRFRLDAVVGYLAILGVFLGPLRGFLPQAGDQATAQAAYSAAERVLYLYLGLSLCAYTAALVLTRRIKGAVAENLRWIALGSAWLFLMRPFFTVVLQGAGDALWYGTLLADMVAQVRKGVFPVFVGQSPFQFNGAIYPLRVAPAFQYLGALLDTLTLRSLGVFAIQNLLLSLQALAALATSYAALSVLIPERRWLACGLGILFVSCPGVLGIVYNTDLYMSWMTVSLVPVALYGLARAHRDPDLLSLFLTGGALGAMWWGHTPIALWATLLVGISYLYLFLMHRPGVIQMKCAACGIAVFAAIAAYPVVSVLFFPPKIGVKSASFQEATAFMVMYFLHQVFPSTLLPLSQAGRSLSDFQAGYALWGLFAISAWAHLRVRRADLRVLLAMACLLVALVTPIPGLTGALWTAVPSFVRNTTGNWVMNRLYLLLAGFLVFAAAIAVPIIAPKRRWQFLFVGILCVWSLFQAHRFAHGSEIQRPLESATFQLQTENVMVTQFAYLVFPKRPDTFTHGVADPLLENRLLSRSTLAEIATNMGSIPPAKAPESSNEFRPDAEKYAGEAWSAREPVVLEPGHRYIAEFDFDHPGANAGVLQISGPTFLREYQLPEYGGKLSFGSGSTHSRRLSLWTSGSVSERLAVHFFPSKPRPLDATETFGRLRVAEYKTEDLPIRVDNWIPYEARVRATQSCWLETPRMYQTWYKAWVNGEPAEVRESPLGLVMVAVPSGESRVRLWFEAPLGLQAAFYLSVAAFFSWGVGLVLYCARRLRLAA